MDQRKKLISSNIVFIGDRNETPGTEDLSGQSGRRLMDMLALDLSEYLSMRRENIHEMDLIPVDAESRRKLLERYDGQYLVLLGKNVQDVILGRDVPPLQIFKVQIDGKGKSCWLLSLPHPSGRNRWYNDKENLALATSVLRSFVEQASTEERNLCSNR